MLGEFGPYVAMLYQAVFEARDNFWPRKPMLLIARGFTSRTGQGKRLGEHLHCFNNDDSVSWLETAKGVHIGSTGWTKGLKLDSRDVHLILRMALH